MTIESAVLPELREPVSQMLAERGGMVDGGGRTISSFVLGLGIGMGIALLLAPQSGEDTREWLADNAGRQVRRWRRKALRTWEDLRENLSSDRVVSTVVRTSKSALGAVTSDRG